MWWEVELGNGFGGNWDLETDLAGTGILDTHLSIELLKDSASERGAHVVLAQHYVIGKEGFRGGAEELCRSCSK